MNLSEYVNMNRSSKKNIPTQEHAVRWQTRVVEMGWDRLDGELGAIQYLSSKWAKGIGADKCIAFARYAESLGNFSFAMEFWKKAFGIEHPNEKMDAPAGGHMVPISLMDMIPTAPIKKKIVPVGSSCFPEHMRPGCLITMQPVDGKMEREFYIQNKKYYAQRKRNGETLLIFCAVTERSTQLYYQARSLNEVGTPQGCDKDFEASLKNFGQKHGSFILHGEAIYYDCQGDERMNYSTCRDVNIEKGSKALPLFVFEPFACLLYNGEPIDSQFERVEVGAEMATDMMQDTTSIRPMVVYRTTEEKRELCAMQKREKREGEVFFTDCEYIAGKSSKEHIIRMKYRTPKTKYLVIDLLPVKAAGFAIGGIKLEDMKGKYVGNIGCTNFTRAQGIAIKKRFEKDGGFYIYATSQGFTHTGKLQFGNFEGFAS